MKNLLSLKADNEIFPNLSVENSGKKFKLLCNLFISFGLIENDFNLDHILLEVEATLMESSQTVKY